MIQLQKGESNMKKMILLVSAFMFIVFLTACNGNSESFDPKVEQEKAIGVMNSVLTSFEEQEKLAEANIRDEANVIAWEKIIEKNKAAISKDLSKEDQKRLLYLLTLNKPEDLSNGDTLSNLLFTRNTEIKNVSLDESKKIFIFDIERSGFDHKLITLDKQDDNWRIVTVQDPE
jgi:ABC-type phosphate/phosphonate transport system substrate-binding protein